MQQLVAARLTRKNREEAQRAKAYEADAEEKAESKDKRPRKRPFPNIDLVSEVDYGGDDDDNNESSGNDSRLGAIKGPHGPDDGGSGAAVAAS